MARKVAFLCLCAATLVLFFLLDNSQFNPALKTLDSVPVSSRQVSSCSLHKGVCTIRLDGLDMSLDMSPRHLPPLEPVQLTVVSPATLKALNMLTWFEGQDMDMGRHYLSEGASSNGLENTSTMTFRGMIPVCTVDQDMIWQLHLRVEADAQLHEYVFNLQSGNHDP